ncbi:uncharacterized mitochondrial protein AtMg00810-like [Lathyrus oleraceus]|uniref:uncharacterized mitochondrial protein AtMg00810-like n=1 Tax=Pisum sativum TaxID=3888 RepID=UPI0021D311C4|nr:uncharacterized mitochondrial protein AtMg00810-like [Pisum sativum]
MTAIGNMVYFIGIEIMHSEKGIILHHLELELLKRFEPLNCKVVVTPANKNQKLDSDSDGDNVDATMFKQLVGSLRYLCNIRPNICYKFGMVSRFMSKPKWFHYQVTVKILRYINGTLKYEVLFPSSAETNSEVLSYSDFDWCGDTVDKRSDVIACQVVASEFTAESEDQSKQASKVDD